MRRIPWTPWLLAALLICLTVPAFSQSGTGVIRGTVFDPARASIPGVKVVLTHVATNVAREAPTNEVGFFLFSGVAPGEYKLEAESKGFKKYSGTFTLVAGQTAVIEPVLEVGSVESVVEVTGAAPIITTESAEVGSVKDNLRIQQLPLNGRSITNLFDLTAGVEGGGNPRVNGLKVGSADMTLDGVSMVDRFGGGIARVQPGLDTVQEFRIETVGSGAQFSRPATVTVVTKSGTNQLHGAVFETFRNNGGGLRARQRQDGNSAAFLARNEFGASAGGPVFIPKLYDGRNKSFWFAAYEGLRQRQKSFYQDTVPTADLWSGNFSSVTDANQNKYTIYDPLSTAANGTRTPFANAVIPQTRINPFFGTMQERHARSNQFHQPLPWVQHGHLLPGEHGHQQPDSEGRSPFQREKHSHRPVYALQACLPATRRRLRRAARGHHGRLRDKPQRREGLQLNDPLHANIHAGLSRRRDGRGSPGAQEFGNDGRQHRLGEQAGPAESIRSRRMANNVCGVRRRRYLLLV